MFHNVSVSTHQVMTKFLVPSCFSNSSSEYDSVVACNCYMSTFTISHKQLLHIIMLGHQLTLLSHSYLSTFN